MGAYTAFLDVALGFGSPALGLIAGWDGLSSVFLAGALLVLGAAPIALLLLYRLRGRTISLPIDAFPDKQAHPRRANQL